MRGEVTVKLIVSLALLLQVQAINWLSIRRASGCNDGSLILRQVNFCRKHPQFMDSLYEGATKALDECQFQFRSKRWNCSFVQTKRGTRSSNQTKKIKNRPPLVPSGTREASFLHAISSAGVAFSITKACSSGNSPDCGCDRSMGDRRGHQEKFKWAGCSDNIDYGVSLSRSFVDAKDHRLSRKNKNKTAALLNLHNNEAGRRIIIQQMKIDCKCHGVSGSCEVKTCWRVMPTFRQIGEILREKFDSALQVEEKRTESRRMLVAREGINYNDVDLVYFKNSPDFCDEDLKKGSLGTKGRSCSQNPKSPNSCTHLCCARGFTTERIRKVERCKCKFEWCCSVQCSECVREQDFSVCN